MKHMIKAAFVATAVSVAAISGAQAQDVKVGVAAEPYPPFTEPGCQRQLDRLGNRIHERRLRRSQAQLRGHPGCLGRHHSGADLRQDRRHRRLDVDHRRAHENHRLLRQVLQHAPVIAVPRVTGITPEAAGRARSSAFRSPPSIRITSPPTFADVAAEVKEYQTQDEANQDLAAGRVDAIMADSLALDAFVKSDAGACCEYKSAMSS
jgi:polar amino acid transport system substrate-binding protein